MRKGVLRRGHHEAIRGEQVLEALRDAPGAGVGPPVELLRVEPAEAFGGLARRVVERARHTVQR